MLRLHHLVHIGTISGATQRCGRRVGGNCLEDLVYSGGWSGRGLQVTPHCVRWFSTDTHTHWYFGVVGEVATPLSRILETVQGNRESHVLAVESILAEMQILIREDFGGIWTGGHRKYLTTRLDHVLLQLFLNLFRRRKSHIGRSWIRKAVGREVEVEADREAVKTRTSPRMIYLVY